MNDRFKFRVWQTELQVPKMKYNSGIGFINNQLDDTSCVIMQCTGLKDKNGKLIYEGDILEDPVHKFEVVWNKYSFVISGASKKGEEKQVYLFPLLARTSEVIGNIYENKELLDE